MTPKVSAKGWVVIPQELRKRYGLREGMPVRFVDYGGILALFPVPQNPVEAGYGMLRGRDLAKRLLEDRQREKERERSPSTGR